jgi:hypothetical protein
MTYRRSSGRPWRNGVPLIAVRFQDADHVRIRRYCAARGENISDAIRNLVLPAIRAFEEANHTSTHIPPQTIHKQDDPIRLHEATPAPTQRFTERR